MPLPLRDSPQWYYGDTHYHSNYANDFKEFGNPVPDTRVAAECIGLDWLVITDHSCDLVDANPYWEEALADSRWAELGLEVEAHSDDLSWPKTLIRQAALGCDGLSCDCQW